MVVLREMPRVPGAVVEQHPSKNEQPWAADRLGIPSLHPARPNGQQEIGAAAIATITAAGRPVAVMIMFTESTALLRLGSRTVNCS